MTEKEREKTQTHASLYVNIFVQLEILERN